MFGRLSTKSFPEHILLRVYWNPSPTGRIHTRGLKNGRRRDVFVGTWRMNQVHDNVQPSRKKGSPLGDVCSSVVWTDSSYFKWFVPEYRTAVLKGLSGPKNANEAVPRPRMTTCSPHSVDHGSIAVPPPDIRRLFFVVTQRGSGYDAFLVGVAFGHLEHPPTARSGRRRFQHNNGVLCLGQPGVDRGHQSRRRQSPAGHRLDAPGRGAYGLRRLRYVPVFSRGYYWYLGRHRFSFSSTVTCNRYRNLGYNFDPPRDAVKACGAWGASWCFHGLTTGVWACIARLQP